MAPIASAVQRWRAGNFRGTRQMVKTKNTPNAARPLRHVNTESGVAPWSYDSLARVELAAKLAATQSTKTTHQIGDDEGSFRTRERLYRHPAQRVFRLARRIILGR